MLLIVSRLSQLINLMQYIDLLPFHKQPSEK